jgi:hypothetical protein
MFLILFRDGDQQAGVCCGILFFFLSGYYHVFHLRKKVLIPHSDIIRITTTIIILTKKTKNKILLKYQFKLISHTINYLVHTSNYTLAQKFNKTTFIFCQLSFFFLHNIPMLFPV